MRATRLSPVVALLLAIGLLPLGTGVALAVDAPPTCTGATSNAPQGVWFKDTIGAPTDQDWYRITVPAARYYQVTLGMLSKNYRLDIYLGCPGSTTYMSNRSGVQAEELYKRLTAGIWYVKVSGVSGAYDPTKPYELRIRPLANRLTVLSSKAWTTEGGALVIVGEALNNTPKTIDWGSVYAIALNSADDVVAVEAASLYLDMLPARQRSAFSVVFSKVPAGYHHHELVVVGETTTEAVFTGLRITTGTPYTTTVGRYYPGTVQNQSAEVAQYVMVSCTLYDARGDVLNVDYDYTDPSTLNPGQVAPYECMFWDHYTGVNRVVQVVEGS